MMRLDKNVVLRRGNFLEFQEPERIRHCKKGVPLMDWLQRDAYCYPFRNHTWPNIVDTNTTANSVILSMHQVLP